jgi:hypothetical protein
VCCSQVVDVGGEVVGAVALCVERADRGVDERDGVGVGALVLVGDDVLDVAAVDGATSAARLRSWCCSTGSRCCCAMAMTRP